jgi:molybdopterin synthase catalytic subunit
MTALASGPRAVNHTGMAHARAELVDRPIDAAALVAEVTDSARGAVCSFVGAVRGTHDGRAVTGLQYSCYEPMALLELRQIVTEAQKRFDDPAIAVEHRVGTLAVGEVSVAISAAHERRAQAIAAMHYVIEELKQRLPVWKLEQYADGTRDWVNAAHAAAGPPPG